MRVPYSRWSDAVLGFLRDVCEPYLRIFRRFIPMIGPLDFSPIVALLVLQIVGNIVVSADPRVSGGHAWMPPWGAPGTASRSSPPSCWRSTR